MPEISIIVPVYKVEAYLPRCIDSILKQTFSDFELLLIDDGSPDNSGDICDTYAKNDKRIKVFHKKNGGVSSARNMGLDLAAGKYIMFCDSDDYVLPTWVQGLYQAISQNDVCLGIGGLFYETKEPFSIKKRDLHIPPKVARADFYCFREHSIDQYVVNKIFKSSTIKKNSLYFDTNMVYGEDAVFVMNYLRSEEGDIGVCCDDSYAYVENVKSASHSYIDNLWNCYLIVFTLRETMLTEFGIDISEHLEHYSQVLLWCVNYSFNNYIAGNSPLSFFQKLKKVDYIVKSEFYLKALNYFKFSKPSLIEKGIYCSRNSILIFILFGCRHLKNKFFSKKR